MRDSLHTMSPEILTNLNGRALAGCVQPVGQGPSQHLFGIVSSFISVLVQTEQFPSSSLLRLEAETVPLLLAPWTQLGVVRVLDDLSGLEVFFAPVTLDSD